MKTTPIARTSQKQKVWLAKQQLCTHVHHAFLYISLRSLHDYGVKIPNFFLFQNLSVVPKKLTPGKFSYIWHFQVIGMSATKFEKARIRFKSDIFAAVAVVNAKAPKY